MKKGYLKIGVVVFAVLGTYTLLACNSAKTGSASSDEQPVDLNAKVASTESENGHGGEVPVAEFDKTIKGEKLTMVDFYTTWCGPCKMMAPHVKKLAAENADLVNVYQIDAEAQVEISGRYNIQAYPTIVFFKKGQVVNTIVGAKSYEALLAEVKKLQ